MLTEWLKLMLEEVARKQSERDAQRTEQGSLQSSASPAAAPPKENARGDATAARKRR